MSERDEWTIGVLPKPMTLEAMIDVMKQINIPECWHCELITSQWLPSFDQGVTYACVECFKMFTVPRELLGAGKPPKHLSINLFGAKPFGQVCNHS